jgi:hypothetical protein
MGRRDALACTVSVYHALDKLKLANADLRRDHLNGKTLFAHTGCAANDG